MDEMVKMTAEDHARKGAWMQTSLGISFYPLDPRPQDIEIQDVARALSRICRFGGHTRRFYSVAEHCLLVSMYVPQEFAGHALLHDLAEAYIGDMVRPLKLVPEMVAFRDAELAIEKCAAQRFGLVWTDDAVAAVKTIDNRLLRNEVGALMTNPSAFIERMDNVQLLRIPHNVIGILPPVIAEFAFLDRFNALFPDHAIPLEFP